MKLKVEVSSKVSRSARVVQVEGMFDVPPSVKAALTWDVDMPIEERQWNVGLIVGPSGCGKSTIARRAWPDQMASMYQWPSDGSILDGFPKEMGTRAIVDLLSSVGFSSPPSWVRPFGVLSNGEQFRVSLARLMAEQTGLAVMDEFTSVVDRTVAQIGSHALAKCVRRLGQQFVAVTCHEDVEEWLQPDWVYRPSEQRFAWRLLRRRPDIDLTINRVHHSAWKLFKHHHYMSAELNRSAVCFVAFWGTRPVAFHAWLPFVGKLKDKRTARRGHRTVCLPDFQGCGIGATLMTYTASAITGLGERVFSNTGHPAEIKSRMRDPRWKCIRQPSFTAKETGGRKDIRRANERLTASFEYVGPAMTRPQAMLVMNTTAEMRA